MIRHIAVAKLRPEITDAEIEQIVDDLRRLPAQIEDIVSYEVGLDALQTDRSYDFGLVSMFKDFEGLNRYLVHEAHTEVASRLRAASQNMAVVDYEIGY